jgi:SpoVK/Ycf46/Vps4 family AAA+-type ATPase
VTQHLVFTGNPGTGKTTVARIVGRIYKEIGLLKSGHIVEAQRADLVGEYTGQTAPKTRGVIDAAMGGVLFIDEAYSLVQDGAKDNYGSEAIATLLQAMEEYRDRFVVIVAGYRDEMRRFVDSNPGLKSRLKTTIDFEDYDTEALFLIFLHMASGAGLRLSMDAQVAVSELMEGLGVRRRGFGNGRTVRNIFEECFARMADRIERSGTGAIDRSMFEGEDIPKPGEKNFD